MSIPEYPNDRSLLSMIFINADEKAYDGAKDFLERMGLPNAEEDEYFLGPNVARLYLPEGLSVSFLHRNVNPLAALWSKLVPSQAVESARVYAARKIRDSQIIQPLYQKDLSPNCCVEIVPGIPRVSVERNGLALIGRSLASRNIDFYIRQEEFVGVLANKDGGKTHLVTNRRAVRLMKSNTFVGDDNVVEQEKIYGGLQAEFRAAHDSGSAHRIRKVLKECSVIANAPDGDPNKILHPYWKRSEGGSERHRLIRYTAEQYEQRLAVS
jgi:hypothetical protein